MGEKELIKSEKELNEWFILNYKQLGYSEIIRKDIGIFPDFIMKKGEKKVRVELETKASHFLLHKHDPKKVDEIICIENDLSEESGLSIISLKNLIYRPRIRRVSATIDGEKKKELENILKKGKYRNLSHIIEEGIKLIIHKEKHAS